MSLLFMPIGSSVTIVVVIVVVVGWLLFSNLRLFVCCVCCVCLVVALLLLGARATVVTAAFGILLRYSQINN